ncbi:YifB family Mg chelatase-like AAA ATPase [Bifidobacterium aesculapii]|uniref:YifB family Mg chelatase-like AAA ATPase n=1 Tax=Bifidobacterium aesculapii TaxID=1329411 RepID=UPI0006E3DE6D|nr:YifB family Mg chelatase-like AAA ATPase [Bifidobacterium aesculapii]
MAIGNALSVGLIGLKAFVVTMQAFISPGLPYFSIIGLPDASLSEARERVKSACQATGFHWPETRVTVNLSPASMPKRGSSHDLAIAAAVLGAAGAIPHECLIGTIVMGELNLDGTVLPINGVLPILLHARERGVRQVVLPAGNMDEAALVEDLAAVGVRHVGELIELMGGEARYRLADPETGFGSEPAGAGAEPFTPPASGDMCEVVGQEQAKWALEVAAAGGHHMIMVGPPGSGKTMLASRFPGIMCPLTESEQLEVASIRSLCGTLSSYGISAVPPYEAPHHTSSTAALVGGGTGLAEPGAITRAHRGVLFMDEAPEFSARALQTLREPLESGYVALSRSKGTTYYPASFQLLMAANGCPCGMSYGTGERCVCTHKERQRYFGRLSGPILDRIDIQVEVPPVPRIAAHDPEARGESSETIRRRVAQARRIAAERYRAHGWTSNAQASGSWMRANISAHALEPINRALESQRLSLRGADRAMRLAWTLADLAGRGSPSREETLQGIALRTRLI